MSKRKSNTDTAPDSKKTKAERSPSDFYNATGMTIKYEYKEDGETKSILIRPSGKAQLERGSCGRRESDKYDITNVAPEFGVSGLPKPEELAGKYLIVQPSIGRYFSSHHVLGYACVSVISAEVTDDWVSDEITVTSFYGWK